MSIGLRCSVWTSAAILLCVLPAPLHAVTTRGRRPTELLIARRVRDFLAAHPQFRAGDRQFQSLIERLDVRAVHGSRADAALSDFELVSGLESLGVRPGTAVPEALPSRAWAGMQGKAAGVRRSVVSKAGPAVDAPANDDCANATTIGLETLTGSTLTATPDGSSSCEYAMRRDIWYKFTAPSAGTYAFDASGSDFPSQVSLHSGCPGDVGNELTCGTFSIGLDLGASQSLSKDQTVYVQVTGADAGYAGDATLTVAKAGGISGNVTEAGSGTPLSGLNVNLYASDGAFVELIPGTHSAGDGSWSTGAVLPPGTYYARTAAGSSTSTHVDELYDGAPCPGNDCHPTLGTGIDVTPGGTTSNIDFALPVGGSISGTIKDADSLAGLGNGYVEIYDGQGHFIGGTPPANDGTYTVSGLPTGSYHAFARLYSQPYLNQTYGGSACASHCDPTSGTSISVTAGATTSGIDFAMTRGGVIAGTITDSATTDGVPYPYVAIFDVRGDFVSSSDSNNDGTYTISPGLPTGTYYAVAYENGYISTSYGGSTCLDDCDVTSGTPISVTEGATRPGIDIALTPGGVVTGTVTDAATGEPLENTSVNILDTSGHFLTGASTQQDGTYETYEGLPSGTYRAVTYNEVQELDQLYDGMSCLPGCDVSGGSDVSVTAGSTTPGVDFALAKGGAIHGRITDAQLGYPLREAHVEIHDSGGNIVPSSWFLILTSENGKYLSSDGLPSGDYYLTADDTTESGNSHHLHQLYSGISCPFGDCAATDGTPVTVTSPSITTGIDLALEPRPVSADGFESTGFGAWTAGSGASPLCAHPMCAEGAALDSACDACVDTIVSADPLCGSFFWDSTCVEETYTLCGISTCEWIVRNPFGDPPK